MTKPVKRKAIIKNYKMGYFVEPKSYGDGDTTGWNDWNKSDLSKSQVNSLADGAQLAASGVNMLQPSNGDTNAMASGGSGFLSGAGTGAKLGAAFGPEGALIGAVGGAVIGGTVGLITGGRKHQQYLTQQKQNTQNNFFNTRDNMTSTNIDPYGSQMGDGDTVPVNPKVKVKTPVKTPVETSTKVYSPQDYAIIYSNSPTYKVRLALTGGNTKPQSAEDIHNTQYTYDSNDDTHAITKYPGNHSVNRININQDQVDKIHANPDEVRAHELSHNTRKLSNQEQFEIYNLSKDPNLNIFKKNNIYNQSNIDLFTKGIAKTGDDWHDSRPDENKADLDALRYLMYKKGIYDTSKKDLDQETLNKALQDPDIKNAFTTKRLLKSFDTKSIVKMNNTIASVNMDKEDPTHSNNYANGDTVEATTNTQQNIINIQKGELLINPQDGKILQEYNGVNPLTGGMFEPHSKGKQKESDNNFTLADPGLFVITKKTAKQYKDAIDNNDKISQKTVLMNIRNAKIAKDGGLQPQQQTINPSQQSYADGDTIQPWDYSNWSKTIGLPTNTIDPNTPVINTTPSVINPISPMTTNDAYLNDRRSLYSNKDISNNGFSTALDTVNKYGPALYNIGQGLFGNAQHQSYAIPITNPERNNIIANMPKNVNMSPIINDIYSNQNLADKSIRNNSNSSVVYRANRENINVNTNKALVNARMQSQEVNNKAAGQRADIYNSLGYQQQQEQQRERDYNLNIDNINSRVSAAKQNLLNAGLSQLQQTSMNDKANSQKAARDQQTIQSMLQIFPMMKYYYNEDGSPKVK